jgi:hypothetical protein
VFVTQRLFFYFINSKNSGQENTFTPRERALSSFEPASSPAKTKVVFLLIVQQDLLLHHEIRVMYR